MNAQDFVEIEALAQERAMLDTIGRIAQLEAARRQALAAVASANGIGDLDGHITALREQVKQWLTLEGLSELVDEETDIAVGLQERKGTPVYDIPTLIKTPDGMAALLAAAEQVGMVQISHKQVEQARKTGAAFLSALAAVEMPGIGSTALVFRNRGKWSG